MASFEPGLLLRVFIMGQLTGELLEQEFSAAGLSRKDFAITSSLRLMQPTTPTALAEQLGMPLTTMSAGFAGSSAEGTCAACRIPPTAARTCSS